jgi:hypothetical protein
MKKALQRLLFCTAIASYSGVAHADSFEDLVRNGKIFGEVRYRYENVEQDGLPRTSTANTLRTNLGFETGSYKGFKVLVEAQTVKHMGDDDYNDTTNGKATYPIIADPENAEFNQAWIMWSGLPKTSFKLGRQAINLDNQRFIGTVGWRQNDQTYDAATITLNPLDKAVLSYSYVWNINRIFGEHNAIPDFTGDSHLLHGEYTITEWLKVAGYGYFLDISQGPAPFAAFALSSRTYGAQLTGKISLNANWKLQYLGEYASQTDYKSSPLNYQETYWHVAPAISWKNLTVQAGFESLGGNGTNAFQTPLATLHAFNGWADKFLTTPANGLEDFYGRVSYIVDGLHPWLNGTTLDAVYHDFRSERTSMDYGSEWDLQASKSFKTEGFVLKDLTLTVKYADYNSDGMATDTNKFWLMAGTKF